MARLLLHGDSAQRPRADPAARRRRTSTAMACASALCALMAIIVSPPLLAADPPPAVIETPMRDPWVPPEALQGTPAPATRGAQLRAQVDRKLASSFAAADVDHTGALTRAQAKAAGLGFIARHFDDIDTQRSGLVRFDDVRRYLDERRTQANSTRR